MAYKLPLKRTHITLFLTLALFTLLFFPRSNVMSRSSYKSQFIQSLAPKILKQNLYIQDQRNSIQAILHNIDDNNPVSRARMQWLYSIAKAYKVKSFSLKNLASRKTLLLRVNTLPTSLVLAQAINESNWGRSRFAKQANNLFGMWCYQSGCGIVPLKRAKNRTFEVKRYSNQSASIQAYFYNINTNPQYFQLRKIRDKIIKSGKLTPGSTLADYLTGYSAQHQYANTIKQIIKQHNLTTFDTSYR